MRFVEICRFLLSDTVDLMPVWYSQNNHIREWSKLYMSQNTACPWKRGPWKILTNMMLHPWISSSGLVWLNNLVKLCFSSPKITHLFRQFRPPTEDFLSNTPTQPPHSRRMRIFSHPQSAQFFVVVAACRTRDLKSILLHRPGVRRLSRRITEEVFRRRMKQSKQVSNFWTWKT